MVDKEDTMSRNSHGMLTAQHSRWCQLMWKSTSQSVVCVSVCECVSVSVGYGEAHFSLPLVWSRRITRASVSLFRYALPSGMSAESKK